MGDSLKVFITVTRCRDKPQQTPSVKKHTPPLRVVNCAIYSTLTRFTKFRVSNLHITSTQDAANTLHLRIFQGRLSLREDLRRRLVPSLDLGTTWARQLQSSSCHYPTAATKCNAQPRQPFGGKTCSSTKGGLLRYILYTLYLCDVINSEINVFTYN